jgi:TOTE conflict system primase-like protein
MSENSKTAAEGSATALGGVDVDRLEQRGLCNPEAEPSKVKEQAAGLMNLFPGHENAHGTHGEPDWDDEKSKWSIRRTARTLPGPPTLELWEEHLAGARPLGVVPIDENSTCAWGCGDVDDYDVDALALLGRIEAAKLPLVPCRSKSGGLHLFLFLQSPEPARAVQAAVRAMMAALGHAGCEIFPKQSQLLVDRGDQGNWMIAPYFGGTFGGKLREQAGLKRTGGGK